MNVAAAKNYILIVSTEFGEHKIVSPEIHWCIICTAGCYILRVQPVSLQNRFDIIGNRLGILLMVLNKVQEFSVQCPSLGIKILNHQRINLSITFVRCISGDAEWSEEPQ